MKNDIRFTPAQLRQIILEQSYRAHVGHIGSALSIADIISALYSDILREDPSGGDRFILSKGHAALALYSALFLKGRIDRAALDSFCGDATLLGVHPNHALPGVEFSTGSLGQGISFAVGAALAAKLRNERHRIFALVSDAECNSGVVWEAVMVAAHHRLSNLYVLVDSNGQQAFGYVKDTLNILPLRSRWESFGWDAHDVDGHDPKAISGLIEKAGGNAAPHVLVARTVFGKGVSFMEGQIKWHYFPMSDEEFKKARQEIAANP